MLAMPHADGRWPATILKFRQTVRIAASTGAGLLVCIAVSQFAVQRDSEVSLAEESARMQMLPMQRLNLGGYGGLGDQSAFAPAGTGMDSKTSIADDQSIISNLRNMLHPPRPKPKPAWQGDEMVGKDGQVIGFARGCVLKPVPPQTVMRACSARFHDVLCPDLARSPSSCRHMLRFPRTSWQSSDKSAWRPKVTPKVRALCLRPRLKPVSQRHLLRLPARVPPPGSSPRQGSCRRRPCIHKA
jgi:hypothetical protein